MIFVDIQHNEQKIVMCLYSIVQNYGGKSTE